MWLAVTVAETPFLTTVKVSADFEGSSMSQVILITLLVALAASVVTAPWLSYIVNSTVEVEE